MFWPRILKINSALAEYASQYSSVDVPGIDCLCFSPNGNYLAVGDGAGRVTVRFVLDPPSVLCNLISLFFQVWDIPKKQTRNIFRDVPYVQSVDFSPNGRLVVSSSGGGVHVWNMRDGSARVFTHGFFTFWSVRFSPSGQLVAAGDTDGDLRIWNVRTGQLMRRWSGHKGNVWSLAFMAEGRVLVSGGDDGVVKWGVSSLQSGGELVVTELLRYEGESVSLFLFISFPVTNIPFFYTRTESIQWLFLPNLNGLPPVYPTVRLSRMPTAPYMNAHWLDTQSQLFRLTSALLEAILRWAVTTVMSPFGGILK